MQILNHAISVDPGDHTGFAIWRGSLYPEVGQFNLKKSKKIISQEDELIYLWTCFSNLLIEHNPRVVYIEGVEFWEGSSKSMMAAKRQNLSKLAYLVGGYGNEAASRGIPIRLLPARIWKGQMSNEVLEQKLFRINGQQYASDHILNAVGIGMSRIGLLLNTKRQPGKAIKSKVRHEGWRS